MFYADSNNIMRLRIRIFCTGVFFIYIENNIYQKIWYNINIKIYKS